MVFYFSFTGTEESAKSSNNGKRVPKHTTCCFCDKLIKGRVMRHILMVHKMHERVKLVLKLSKGSPERKKLLGFLLTEVYFKHNKKVLETGTGELVVHKKQAHLPASSFRPCKRCKQLIQTKKWKGHETVCMSYDSEFGEFMQCLGDGVVDESESDSEDDEYMTVEDSDYDAGKLQIVEESGSDGGKSETSPPGGLLISPLTHCILVDSSIIICWMSPFVILGVYGWSILSLLFYFLWNILFANNVDLDQWCLIWVCTVCL